MITNLLILFVILIIPICLTLRGKRKSIGKLYWHIHHNKLLEMATEPVARRRAYIVRYKSAYEIGTRLLHLRPVKGVLPGEIIEAFRFYADILKYLDKIWESYWSVNNDHRIVIACKLLDEICKARDKADRDLQLTLQKYESEINRLHDKECCCSWNGTTLFPGGSDGIGATA